MSKLYNYNSSKAKAESLIFLLKQGDYPKVFTIILQAAEENNDKSLIENTIQLAARYGELENMAFKDLLTKDYLDMERSKIKKGLVQLLYRLDKK